MIVCHCEGEWWEKALKINNSGEGHWKNSDLAISKDGR